MQVRLRERLTVGMTGLVALGGAVLSGVFVGQLLEQVLQETDKRAHEIAQQVFQQAQRALTDAAEQGLRPASNDPHDIHDFVRRAFEINVSLHAQLKAAKDTPAIYEVSVTDHEGMALVSTDESLPGKFLPRRTALSQLTQRGYAHQVRVLAGPARVHGLAYPVSTSEQA